MVPKTLPTAVMAVAFVAVSASGYAADEYNVTTGATLEGVPLGVHGVDTVALSTLNAVAAGDASHTVVVDGVAYYFASAQTAKMFKESPDMYLPQYGGFCAFAVALGKKLDGDPRYADIVDGKLYLFVNDVIFQKYKKSPRKTLAKAEEVWPSIQHKSADSL